MFECYLFFLLLPITALIMSNFSSSVLSQFSHLKLYNYTSSGLTSASLASLLIGNGQAEDRLCNSFDKCTRRLENYRYTKGRSCLQEEAWGLEREIEARIHLYRRCGFPENLLDSLLNAIVEQS